MQRLVGLANARGRYVLALDDDDCVHPAVTALTTAYFERFPDSWVLRLRLDRVPASTAAAMDQPWAATRLVAPRAWADVLFAGDDPARFARACVWLGRVGYLRGALQPGGR